MPGISKKKCTPLSRTDNDDDNAVNDGDFLQNPDLCKDILPQPFRMIDKVLHGVVEDVLDVIHATETEKLTEAQRYKAPKYECALKLEVRFLIHICSELSESGTTKYCPLPELLSIAVRKRLYHM